MLTVAGAVLGEAMSTPPITYWDYLHLLPLLELQGGLGDSPDGPSEDELHFIVVHQVFELWFKLVLRELRLARDHMAAEWVGERAIPLVVRHLRRVNEVFKLSVDAFGVLETLTPQDFLAFRKKLGESSGFQSFQMRQLEMLLGLQPTERERHKLPDPITRLEEMARQSPGAEKVLKAIQETRQEKTLRDALLAWLQRTPIQGSGPQNRGDEDVIARFIEGYRAGVERYDPALLPGFDGYLTAEGPLRPRVGLLFIETYRELPLLAWPNFLIETIVEMEELLVLWRTRHARMVERIIGRRPGTGGSSGVSYLDQTAQYRIFQEFWAVRSILIPREFRPRLERPELYQLAEEFLPHPGKG
jgi:tryptophan 2,3-dioxygenase